MKVERDVAVRVDDGVELRADVFRPDTSGPVPVIMTMGPYGKGVRYQDGTYKASWAWMQKQHPDVLPGSQQRFLAWETVDPEMWVGWGYAVVRVDSRGAGRSPGLLEIFSPREAQDYHDCIEWFGTREWCSGKVGLLGISYYAINQWQVAALQPPHLAAMIPWEGASDAYRDMFRHGGILSNRFFALWYEKQVRSIQHGYPDACDDPWLNSPSTGPAQLSTEQLFANRIDVPANAQAREMDDDWYRARSPDFSKVVTPFLSAANWGGYGLHARGNFEAFTRAASAQKWLECHPGKHEEWFYLNHGMDLQRRFLDHFLKGVDNGWATESRVLLHLRRPFTDEAELRREEEWPLRDTNWTPLYLDAGDGELAWAAPEAEGDHEFDAKAETIQWRSPPLEQETELTGPLSLKLFMSSSTSDADLFVTLQAFSPDDREVQFTGAVEPNVPLAQGWLRASHRALCPERSAKHRPFHSHAQKQPLMPGEVYELDIEIWPTCIILPAGFRLALDIRGKDFSRSPSPSLTTDRDTGSGIFLHDDRLDRPEEIFGGRTTIYSGAAWPSRLTLPVIPAR